MIALLGRSSDARAPFPYKDRLSQVWGLPSSSVLSITTWGPYTDKMTSQYWDDDATPSPTPRLWHKLIVWCRGLSRLYDEPLCCLVKGAACEQRLMGSLEIHNGFQPKDPFHKGIVSPNLNLGKFHVAFEPSIMVRSVHNCAHATTVEPSSHVLMFDA